MSHEFRSHSRTLLFSKIWNKTKTEKLLQTCLQSQVFMLSLTGTMSYPDTLLQTSQIKCYGDASSVHATEKFDVFPREEESGVKNTRRHYGKFWIHRALSLSCEHCNIIVILPLITWRTQRWNGSSHSGNSNIRYFSLFTLFRTLYATDFSYCPGLVGHSVYRCRKKWLTKNAIINHVYCCIRLSF